jgi:hypothetical protein
MFQSGTPPAMTPATAIMASSPPKLRSATRTASPIASVDAASPTSGPDVSVVGGPVGRERLGLAPRALTAVITPLARFEPSPDGPRLTEIVTGLDRAELARRTGLALGDGDAVRVRPELTAEERSVLAELREAVERNRAPLTT